MWPSLSPESLRFTLALPGATPSNNEIKGMHFGAYKTLRTAWQLRVWAALNGRRPAKPLVKVFLAIDRSCSGAGLDWDNAYGGLKPMLDCLVMPSTRNPSGLGLILDDNPKSMPYPPYLQQHTCPQGADSTVVRIYDLTSLPS